jgi:hypothetical protein
MDSEKAEMQRFFAVIPAGGIGSRLWPMSRANAPKFLHDLTGNGQTLLQDTWDRLQPLADGRTMVVTGDVHARAVADQLPELDFANVILEPSPRIPPPQLLLPLRFSRSASLMSSLAHSLPTMSSAMPRHFTKPLRRPSRSQQQERS